MGYYLGIDLGTSYFKAGIFDESGHLKGLGRQFVPKNTDDVRCELPLDVFWKTIRTCLDEAMQMAAIQPDCIQSISYSTQANSFVLLDLFNQPLTPLILWPDKRANGMELPVGHTDELMQRTGLGIPPNTQFTVAKLNWFRQRRPDIREKACSILSISDFLTFSLTGHKMCDYSTASMLCMFDIENLVWLDEALEKIGIHAGLLPIPQRTGTFVGVTTAHAAGLIGLPPGIPFFLGGLDHHIAAIGAGIPTNGYLCVSNGTVLSCVDYTDGLSPQKYGCVAPGLHPGRFFRMMFDNNGASSLEWYQKNHAPEYSIEQLLEMASQVKPGCDGLTAYPCANRYPGLTGFTEKEDYPFQHAYLFDSLFEPTARRLRKTYSKHFQHGHYVRALLESTACSLKEMVGDIRNDRAVSAIVASGGGSRSELWIEIKSDIVQAPFLIPECTELSCMGAAMVGALGTKLSDDYDTLVATWVRFKLNAKTNGSQKQMRMSKILPDLKHPFERVSNN